MDENEIQLIKLSLPDDSISFFESIKTLSESFWTSTDIDRTVFGFQVQKDTKWLTGLSEEEIARFERDLDMIFPEGLKNFYRTMNGLDKPGINVYGDSGEAYSYTPIYYSFPADLEVIKGKIEWILEANQLTMEKLKREKIPMIFPVTGHRFLVLDENLPVLSMYGDDIIYWTDSISKLIVTDTFDNVENVSDFESDGLNFKPVKFWLEEK